VGLAGCLSLSEVLEGVLLVRRVVYEFRFKLGGGKRRAELSCLMLDYFLPPRWNFST